MSAGVEVMAEGRAKFKRETVGGAASDKNHLVPQSNTVVKVGLCLADMMALAPRIAVTK